MKDALISILGIVGVCAENEDSRPTILLGDHKITIAERLAWATQKYAAIGNPVLVVASAKRRHSKPVVFDVACISIYHQRTLLFIVTHAQILNILTTHNDPPIFHITDT